VTRAKLPMGVGARMRQRRTALGLSLGQLAMATGTTKSHLSEIEAEKSVPSVLVGINIAAALGVSVQWLFTLYGDDPTSTPEVVLNHRLAKAAHAAYRDLKSVFVEWTPGIGS
jgi:transcriptional regulator with XRE-family HTH domain